MFCARWVALRCAAAFSCLPNISSDALQGCQNRYQPVCDTWTAARRKEIAAGAIVYDATAAKACFDDWQADGCHSDLKSLLGLCAPLFKGLLTDGMLCTAYRECARGTYCDELQDAQGRCQGHGGEGTCKTFVGPGADCSQVACAPGYTCNPEFDARGLPIQVCRGSGIPDGGVPLDASIAPTPMDAGGCNPWEMRTPTGICITKSLPGQPCGGEFNLTCLGDSTCGTQINVNGMSCVGEAEPGAGCTPYVTNAGQIYRQFCTDGYECIDHLDYTSCGFSGANCFCDPIHADWCTSPDLLLPD